MLFLPCGFNRRRHSAPGDRTRHTVPARTRGTWDTHPGSRTRLAARHDAVEASSSLAIVGAAGGTPSPLARWRRRRRRRRRRHVVWICGARGRRLVKSYVCTRDATRRRPWVSRRDQRRRVSSRRTSCVPTRIGRGHASTVSLVVGVVSRDGGAVGERGECFSASRALAARCARQGASGLSAGAGPCVRQDVSRARFRFPENFCSRPRHGHFAAV